MRHIGKIITSSKKSDDKTCQYDNSLRLTRIIKLTIAHSTTFNKKAEEKERKKERKKKTKSHGYWQMHVFDANTSILSTIFMQEWPYPPPPLPLLSK